MYHAKIDMTAALPLRQIEPLLAPAAEERRPGGRLLSILIVAFLPVMLVGFLAQLIWDDVKAIGHGFAIFAGAAAEELSRR